MPFDQLNADIILNIVYYGGLSIQDVLSISLVNSATHSLLKPDHIWETLFQWNWGKTIREYELNLPANTSFFDRVIATVRAENAFKAAVSNEKNRSAVSTASLLASFDNHPLFIATKLYSSLENEAHRAYNNGEEVDLTLLSMANAFTLRQNYRLATQWIIKNVHTSPLPPAETDFELFWFRFSLFDKAFNQLLPVREQKLKQIEKKLANDIHYNILLQHTDDKIRLGNDSRSIWFHDENTYVEFVWKIGNIASSFFSVEEFLSKSGIPFKDIDPSKLGTRIHLENYSILRVYAGQAVGTVEIHLAILLKILRAFLGRYQIVIGSAKPEIFKIELSKQFLDLGRFHLYLKPSEDRTRSFHLEVLRSHELRPYLRRTLNLQDDSIDALLSPIDLSYYLTSINFNDLISYNELYSQKFDVLDPKIFKDDIPTYSTQAHHFVKAFLAISKLKEFSRYSDYLHCVSMSQAFTDPGLSIHFKAVIDAFADNIGISNMLSQYFNEKEQQLHSIYPYRPNHQFQDERPSEDQHLKGSWVIVQRSQIGVVIGVHRKDYRQVYCCNCRSIHVCRASDLDSWVAQYAKPHILSAIKQGGFEAVGIYAQSIKPNGDLVMRQAAELNPPKA